MKTRTEERLVRFGCLTVLVGLSVFGYLAFSSHWAYSVAVAGLIGVGWLIVQVAQRRDHSRHVEMLGLAFAPSGLPVPQLKDGSSYGFPSFTLTFASEAELRQAEAQGCIAAFKDAVQTVYGHTGSKRNPFSADQAVWATYVGWQPSFGLP